MTSRESALLRKSTSLIGQNNSGKSNILLFLTRCWGRVHGPHIGFTFEALDRHIGDSSGRLVFEVGIEFRGPNYEALLKGHQDKIAPIITGFLEKLFKSEVLTNGTGLAWFRYDGEWGKSLSLSQTFIEMVYSSQKILTHSEWEILWSALTNQTGGNIKGNCRQGC